MKNLTIGFVGMTHLGLISAVAASEKMFEVVCYDPDVSRIENLNSVNLLLVAFSSLFADAAGQIFVFFTMTVAAAEVAVGLAIIVMIYRNTRSIDIGDANKLKW
jgi:UDP-glucose 6-dehydrogenase